MACDLNFIVIGERLLKVQDWQSHKVEK